MERTTAETIREISRDHLTNGNGLLFCLCGSAVGWVGGTVPVCEGLVEIPLSVASFDVWNHLNILEQAKLLAFKHNLFLQFI